MKTYSGDCQAVLKRFSVVVQNWQNCHHIFWTCSVLLREAILKSKGSSYSITERSWSRFLAVRRQVTWVINPAIGCHYFPPGPQLPSQPFRGLLPILLLGEQRHDGCKQFAQDCYPTPSRLRFKPRPYCVWVQHINHSATEQPYTSAVCYGSVSVRLSDCPFVCLSVTHLLKLLNAAWAYAGSCQQCNTVVRGI